MKYLPCQLNKSLSVRRIVNTKTVVVSMAEMTQESIQRPHCARPSVLWKKKYIVAQVFSKIILNFQSWKCNIIRQILTYIIMHNADINLWVYPNVTSKPNIWTNVSKTMLAAMTSNYITKIHWLAIYFFQWIAFLCIYPIRHLSDKENF